jgi:hypothetical protein
MNDGENGRSRMRKYQCLVLISIFFCGGITWADEVGGFSGKLSLEGGGTQAPSSALETDSYYRLFLRDEEDLVPEFSVDLAGEANWQTLVSPAQIPWPLYPRDNVLKLESDNFTTNNGSDLFAIQLDRANLRWASGSLDITAGLFKPKWGSSYFYRPTDYFFPLEPLTWQADEPLGSEGLDASCFLFDDFSLEGATRWLKNGDGEEVLRLVNKGIGLTVTPSAAWMIGRNGFGLELEGTFPTLQVMLEGVDWLYPDGHTAANWTAGLSTTHEGVKYTAEVLRDQTGEILGVYSDQAPPATYVFISAEGKFFEQWQAAPALVAPLEGGPFVFWTKISWAFAPQWQAGFQAQVLLGNWKGPLDLYTGRAGVSLTYSL